MRSTSKKVKISVVSSSGEVKTQKPLLSQILLSHLEHERKRLVKECRNVSSILDIDIHSF